MTSTPPFALARYRSNDTTHYGLVVAEKIRRITPEDLGVANLNDFLAAPNWDSVARLAEASDDWMALSDVTLVAPVEPRQVLQAGANYREHVIELVAAGLTTNTDTTPEQARQRAAHMMDERREHGEPYFFIGLPACVVGDDVPLVLPAASKTHDWELELAVVIGREAFQVSTEDAMSHVAGFTIVNDISTREYTFRQDMKEIGSDWYRSKNSPGFLPTGPYLVPAQFVDHDNLTVRLELNGEIKQNANTNDLLFDIPTLIATASRTAPLLPGDLLLTGSPAGNGQHWQRFLQDGDVLTGTIEGLGTQTIHCVAQAERTTT